MALSPTITTMVAGKTLACEGNNHLRDIPSSTEPWLWKEYKSLGVKWLHQLWTNRIAFCSASACDKVMAGGLLSPSSSYHAQNERFRTSKITSPALLGKVAWFVTLMFLVLRLCCQWSRAVSSSNSWNVLLRFTQIYSLLTSHQLRIIINPIFQL